MQLTRYHPCNSTRHCWVKNAVDIAVVLANVSLHARDRGWETHGLSASIQHQLWEVLKSHPKGITVSEITKELGSESEDKEVLQFCLVRCLHLLLS